MKHPIDEYRDANETAERLRREHEDAKVKGYYEGTTGSGTGGSFVRAIAKLLIILLVLGFIAVAALVATGNEDAIDRLLQYFR